MELDYGNLKIQMGDGFTSFKLWDLKKKGTFIVNSPSPPNRHSFYVENPAVAMLSKGQPVMIKCDHNPRTTEQLMHKRKELSDAFDAYKNPEIGIQLQQVERQIHDCQIKGTGAIRYIEKIIGKLVIMNMPLEVTPRVGGSVTLVLGYNTNYVNEKDTEILHKIQKERMGGSSI